MSTGASALYVGRVMHRRTRPRPHALAYRVFWVLLDLDEIDALDARLRLFSRDRANVFSFRTADYGDRSGRPLRPQIEERLAAAGIDTSGGPIRLLTMPRILGYAFNPLSVFFCHRVDGSLAATIYEVHNTFGEIHSYLIPAEGASRPIVQDSAKAFHVSPFLTRDMSYRFRLQPPGDDVAVHIAAKDSAGPMVYASLSGERRPLTDRNLLKLLVTHPLLTLRVTLAIHWHALLLVAKRIPLIRHPGPAAADVTVGRQAP
ncbi:DUF1365 domain-containing protein [Phreatobacter oligotrophus]|uniref:DUF1365 family protein n=1 Tax=Phreatobacter oligotrophus TaxID=1122261 RepID=A0A2T4YZX7_9HYPH|nr:DUF1365 family protein [Phreatobacter oligotrophus]PTM52771.1 hypothetical protein C8P69_10748 [Phreatobacter oligotrophus]